ncbi:MAG: HlyD family efflux transporter periplasmic adaptor subunit [Alphaproteobacteria bacterium]|nr:HlyD family efflux transporter periplasmic adaptor subunit [Alphaproteobacteria bacterium]
MTALPKMTALAMLASLALMSACGGPGAGEPPKPGSKEAIAAAAAVETPYAAIASGKVDIEGGLVDVAARAPGIVKDVLVQEGDKVVKDQILARQDDADARLSRNRVAAQLNQAEAQLPILEVQIQAASREQARLERLVAETAVSQQVYEQAMDVTRQMEAQVAAQRSSVMLARAQLAEANYQVELYVVRAPADGRIVRRYANPGSGASTLQVTPLFQLQPDTQRIVRAELEERSLSLVSAGQKVEIVPESDQTATYPGSVIRIAEVMGSRKLKSDDPSERTDERVVEVVIDAESAPVLVGQRVFVKFLKGDGKTAQR